MPFRLCSPVKIQQIKYHKISITASFNVIPLTYTESCKNFEIYAALEVVTTPPLMMEPKIY